MKNKKYLLILLLLLIPIFIFVRRSFAISFDHEIKSISIDSKEYPDPGSYHIEKSAKWIETGKAQVTFDINSVMKLKDGYKDVILVIDVSGSMGGEKINRVKKDATELVDLLLSDSHNRVALIEFETTSYLELEFTNDKDKVIDKINHMYVYDSTNYDAALQDVDRIMENYQKQDDRSVTLMFLTDGYPNININNQIATYHLLKEKYPYMEINGVQYEMGNRIIKAIIDISDNQWSAFIETLHNVLFDASLSPKRYSNYVLTDYIDNEYFYLESIDDVEVNMGTVRLEVEDGIQKVIWDLSNELSTISKAKMDIKLSLKDKYKNKEGFFPTNKKETIVSKLDGNEEKINSDKTPVLSGKYSVIYDVNAPSECSINTIAKEAYYPFTNVTRKNISLHCDDYNFRGWVIKDEDNEDITHINDDVFVMPSHDVRIVAIWEKITPVKSMSGEVKQNANTLFDIMRMSAVPDDRPSQYVTGENGIDFTQQASDTNGKGVYELRSNMVVSDAENVPIYYFRGQVDNDFVLFGGYCWQIVRTTPDKGVKLLFYGEPTGDNHDQCNGSRRNLYVEESWMPDPKYYYSSYDNYVLGIRGGNVVDGGTKTYSGWMINQSMYDRIDYSRSTDYSKTMDILEDDIKIGYRQYYYSTSYEYDEETGLYRLVNPTKYYDNSSSTIGKYTFDSENYSETSKTLKYIVRQHTSYGTKYSWVLYLKNGIPLETYKNAVVGTGLIENGDGTYTITDTETIDFTIFNQTYSSHMKKYLCDTLTSTCSNPMFMYTYTDWRGDIFYIDAKEKVFVSKDYDGSNMIDTNSVRLCDYIYNTDYQDYKYLCDEKKANCDPTKLFYSSNRNSNVLREYYNRYYGASVTYDGEYYHLVDYVGVGTFAINSNSLNTRHYFCVGYGETKCKTVYYALQTGGSISLKLENGELDPIKVFNKRKEVQVDENKNPINGSYDSNFKVILDSFYEAKLMDYDNYIDDAVWCNSRVATDEAYQNSFLGGNNYGYLKYDSGNRSFPSQGRNEPNYHHPVIKCEDKLDAYTVNDTVRGNGFLKHPIALITADEYVLTGLSNRDSYIGEGDSYWYTMTPAYTYSAEEGYLFQDGSDLWCYGGVSRNVKPSIVLKPSITVKSGNGTKDNPYQLDLD